METVQLLLLILVAICFIDLCFSVATFVHDWRLDKKLMAINEKYFNSGKEDYLKKRNF